MSSRSLALLLAIAAVAGVLVASAASPAVTGKQPAAPRSAAWSPAGEEREFTFKPPFARLGELLVPYFQSWGDVEVMEDRVRLTPDRQSRRGATWSQNPFVGGEAFEAELKFAVSGQGKLGADGLAFWFVKDRPEPGSVGNFFGHVKEFRGFAVVVDTYDNDNSGLHPYVQVLMSSGNQSALFDDEHDHSKDADTKDRGGCRVSVRRRQSEPVPESEASVLRMTYERGVFRVDVDEDGDGQFLECASMPVDVSPIGLQDLAYFGVTAATGDLGDNHDVFSLEVRNLGPRRPPRRIYNGDQLLPAALSHMMLELNAGVMAGNMVAGRDAGSVAAASDGVTESRTVTKSLHMLETLVRELKDDVRRLNDVVKANGGGGGGGGGGAATSTATPLSRSAATPAPGRGGSSGSGGGSGGSSRGWSFHFLFVLVELAIAGGAYFYFKRKPKGPSKLY